MPYHTSPQLAPEKQAWIQVGFVKLHPESASTTKGWKLKLRNLLGPTRRNRLPTARFGTALAWAMFAAALSGGATPAIAQEGKAEREPYTINPGDVLEVSVWKEPDLQREVLVRPDGAFSFPLAGDVVATGRTVEQVRQELTSRLQVYIPDLVVTVTVAAINGNKIYVIGQVNTPGEFVVNPRVDVIQALSIAGGMTPFAEVNNIKIIRRQNGSQTVLPFRYTDILKGQSLEQNIVLEVGDVVLVP